MFRVGLVTFLCMLAALTVGGHSASPTPAPQATPTSQNVKVIGRTWRDFCGSRITCELAATQQS